jgi:hypothetical protein
MDYRRHYERLIDRARARVIIGYRECHHIIPRCIGGLDEAENLVELTAKEHYLAHQLLVKIYPANGRIAYAAVMMAPQAIGRKAFGWLRQRHADSVRLRRLGSVMTEETKSKIAATKRGKKQLAEVVERRVAPLRGRKRPEFSAEWRARIGAASRGKKRKPRTLEHRANMSAAQKGRKKGLNPPEAHRSGVPRTAVAPAAARPAETASPEPDAPQAAHTNPQASGLLPTM